MRDTFIATLGQILKRDKDTYLLTGDLGFCIFDEIRKYTPDQFINVGVAEQNMVGIATGMSLTGKKVFCYSIANFVFMRNLEQIRNGPIYHDTNVTLVCSGGGFSYGQLGYSHFAIEDYGILSTLKKLNVFLPSTSEQVRESTIRCHQMDGPKYLRLEKNEFDHKKLTMSVDAENEVDSLGLSCYGKGNTKKAVVAIGGLLDVAVNAYNSMKAANKFSVYSITDCNAVYLPYFRQEMKQYEFIVVIEEHVEANSIGQKIKANLVDTEVLNIAINEPYPSFVGDQSYLREYYNLTEKNIISQF